MNPFAENLLLGWSHPVACWLLFSLMYIWAAYHKNFHVDEFYSWVYANRCTYKEILVMKDGGIGHPPLFHLMQKLMQQITPGYHQIYVRLLNYFIGSVFVIVIIKMLSRYRNLPIFYYAIASSAGLLNAFVFARMWGMVTFSSLILVSYCESKIESNRPINQLVLLFIILMGLFSDFNYIILVPYVFIIYLAKSRYKNILILIFFLAGFGVSGLLMRTPGYAHDQEPSIFYNVAYNYAKVCYEYVLMYLNFWYEEWVVYFLIILIFSCHISTNQQASFHNLKSFRNKIQFFLLCCLVLLGLLLSYLNMKLVSVFYMIAFILIIYNLMPAHSVNTSGIRRAILAVIFGTFALFCADSIIQRDLIDARFLLLFLPFIYLILYCTLPVFMVYCLSVVMIFSGVLYIFSGGVGDYYPPPPASVELEPVIFQNEFAYSTQYLVHDCRVDVVPLILDKSQFSRFCRICDMGTDRINFDAFHRINVLARSINDPSSFLPTSFKFCVKREVGLPWIDRMQMKYLTPVYRICFCIYEYENTAKPAT